MLEVYERLGVVAKSADTSIVLDYGQREKGRLRVRSTDGLEVRVFLERGKSLSVGELLRSRCGRYIRVDGAEEKVVTAQCDDWRLFSRACYHLGNRHVKIQIGECWLRIAPDHVLEEMLILLGLTVIHECAVFEPESGAYGHHHH